MQDLPPPLTIQTHLQGDASEDYGATPQARGQLAGGATAWTPPGAGARLRRVG